MYLVHNMRPYMTYLPELLSLPLNVYLKCGLMFKRIEKLVTASQTEAKAVRFVIFLSLLGLKGLRTSSDFFNFAFFI